MHQLFWEDGQACLMTKFEWEEVLRYSKSVYIGRFVVKVGVFAIWEFGYICLVLNFSLTTRRVSSWDTETRKAIYLK